MRWASSGGSFKVGTAFATIIYIKLHADNNAVLPILSLYSKVFLFFVFASLHLLVFELGWPSVVQILFATNFLSACHSIIIAHAVVIFIRNAHTQTHFSAVCNLSKNMILLT